MNSISAASAGGSLGPSPELEETFRQVVGGVFFGQLFKALRQSVGKPAYIHGGQAEEMFQSQLDQYVVEDLAGRQSGPWIDELYRQFLVQLDGGAGEPVPAQPSQLHQPVQSEASSPRAELLEAARQTQPVSEGAGITTAAAALSGLFRK